MNFRLLSITSALSFGFLLLAGCSSGGSDEPDQPINRAPVFNAQAFSATEDTQLAAQLVATDPDGNPMAFSRVTNAQHGQVTVSTSGALTYAPDANYSGTDSFTANVNDGAGGQTTATVTINVTAVNDAPAFSSANTLALDEDMPATLQLTATDADGNAPNFELVTTAQHGTITVSAAGAVSYTPAPNYSGTDSFTARVSDGAGGETTSTFAISVRAVNDAPILTTGPIHTSENARITLNLTWMDPDSVGVVSTLAVAATHGQAEVTASGLMRYIPDPGYSGPDNVTIALHDGIVSVNWPLAITVLAVNDPPVLTSTALTTNEDTTLTSQLTSTDPDGDTVTYSLEAPIAPSQGQVTISASGQLQYVPSSNFAGNVSVGVNLNDGALSSVGQILITVNPVNDAPVAADDEIRIATGAPMTMDVAANDSDVEGALTVSIVQQPAGGTVTVGANNVLTFAPTNAFAGPITFTYRATDGGGAHDDATVRALIGDFQGIVFLGDELTPGRQEIYLFDGLHSTRLVQASPRDYEFITRFTLSGDGTKLMYVIAGPLVDQVFFKPIHAPGPGTLIFQNAPLAPASLNSPVLALNHTGTYALIEDRYSSAIKRIHVVNTTTGAAGLLGGDEPQVVRASLAVFNSQDENQVVLQGQIGGTVPTNGAEYYTAFVASVLTPRDLTQIGADYPQAQGSGSGYGFWFGGAGRYIYHTEGLMTPSPSTRSLLLWDNVSQSETVVYRRPIGTERGIGQLAYPNADGSKVCFSFTEPNPTSQSGPAAYYVAGHAMPSAATPISLVYPDTSDCVFASDGDTVIMQPFTTASGNRQELFSVSATIPGTPTQLSHALAPGEALGARWVASDAPRLVIGYRFPPAEVTSLYSVPAAGGPELQFATDYESGAVGAIDDNGLLLAYVPVEGNRRVLKVRSTQAPGHSWSISSPASTSGVYLFRWLPRP